MTPHTTVVGPFAYLEHVVSTPGRPRSKGVLPRFAAWQVRGEAVAASSNDSHRGVLEVFSSGSTRVVMASA
jgi:hypothetical protein